MVTLLTLRARIAAPFGRGQTFNSLRSEVPAASAPLAPDDAPRAVSGDSVAATTAAAPALASSCPPRPTGALALLLCGGHRWRGRATAHQLDHQQHDSPDPSRGVAHRPLPASPTRVERAKVPGLEGISPGAGGAKPIRALDPFPDRTRLEGKGRRVAVTNPGRAALGAGLMVILLAGCGGAAAPVAAAQQCERSGGVWRAGSCEVGAGGGGGY